MKARSRLDKKMTTAVAKVHISFIHMLNGKKLYNFRIYKPEEQLSDVFLCLCLKIFIGRGWGVYLVVFEFVLSQAS